MSLVSIPKADLDWLLELVRLHTKMDIERGIDSISPAAHVKFNQECRETQARCDHIEFAANNPDAW